MTQSPLWHRHLIDRVHGTLLHYCSSHVWCFERWVAHRQPTVCIALTHLPTLSCSSPTNPSPMACCNAHIYTNLNIYLYVYIILQKKSQGQETLVYSICTHIYMYIYIWIFCIHSIYTAHYKTQLMLFWVYNTQMLIHVMDWRNNEIRETLNRNHCRRQARKL